jgi:hypothetical protein
MVTVRRMGRPPKKPEDRATEYTPFKPEDAEVFGNLQTLAKREGVSMSEILNRAFKDYWKLHGPGNFQTLLGSYEEDGEKSLGQVEQACVVAFQKRGKSGVKKGELHEWLIREGLTEARPRLDSLSRVVPRLFELGVEVSQ